MSEPVCILARVLLVDSLVVTHVEFPTFCHSSLRRAGLVSLGDSWLTRVENSLAATRELLGQPYGRCELWVTVCDSPWSCCL